MSPKSEALPSLSMVIVAFGMERELPRTLHSLSPAMQRGIEPGDYELIAVDNGSVPPLEPVTAPGSIKTTWLRIDDAPPSPAAAVNLGIESARADLVGVMVDGARLASPGLLRNALLASRLDERALVITLGFHLGWEPQQRSVAAGYDADAEDKLLAESGWLEDGYRLFDISAWAESSEGGWAGLPAESNALFMRRAMWHELGGMDEAFAIPGGGLVNLDLLARACELPGVHPVILLGEGTFHQVHGGVSTNSLSRRWEEYHAEYLRLRGKEYARPAYEPTYLGTRLPPAPF